MSLFRNKQTNKQTQIYGLGQIRTPSADFEIWGEPVLPLLKLLQLAIQSWEAFRWGQGNLTRQLDKTRQVDKAS